jgi:hypothetical protein
MFFRHKKRFKGVFRGNLRVTAWDNHRLLYVRIPKCGNTAIRRSLEHGVKRRMSKTQIIRMDDDWTRFSFVRNPWARTLSTFNHKATIDSSSPRMIDGVYQGFVDHGIPVRANMGFEEFCELICSIPDEKTDKHLRSQASYLMHNDAAIVPFIGKIESMTEDWSRLMLPLGIETPLKHINRTQHAHQHYSHFYKDTALVNLVGDRYAEDIRHFNYDFERS